VIRLKLLAIFLSLSWSVVTFSDSSQASSSPETVAFCRKKLSETLAPEHQFVSRRVNDSIRLNSNVILMPSFILFFEAIKSILKRKNIDVHSVFVRSFNANRLPEVLLRGTDRDSASTVYDVPEIDSSASTRMSLGITDDLITYGATLDLTNDEPMTIPFGESDRRVRSHMSMAYDLGENKALGVWLPNLKRLSPVEYAFDGDPKKSLVIVLLNEPSLTRGWKNKYRESLRQIFDAYDMDETYHRP